MSHQFCIKNHVYVITAEDERFPAGDQLEIKLEDKDDRNTLSETDASKAKRSSLLVMTRRPNSPSFIVIEASFVRAT